MSAGIQLEGGAEQTAGADTEIRTGEAERSFVELKERRIIERGSRKDPAVERHWHAVSAAGHAGNEQRFVGRQIQRAAEQSAGVKDHRGVQIERASAPLKARRHA